jgi:hypothetical protein
MMGFLVTGVALLVIGLLLGRIGRAARTAESALPELPAPSGPVPLVDLVNLAVQRMAPTTPALRGRPLRWVSYHRR